LPISWQTLAGQVNANIVQQTQLIEIVVVDNVPLRAKVIADEIARQLILQSPSGVTDEELRNFTQSQIDELKEKILNAQAESVRLSQELDVATGARRIQEIQGQISTLETKINSWQDIYSKLLASLEGGDVNALALVEEAEIPSSPISPNKQMNLVLAAAAGAILSIAGIFIVEYLDDTLKTPAEVARITGLTSLGNIGMIDGKNFSGRLVTVHDPLSPVTEDFRVLQMNLLFSTVDRPLRTILFTSSGSMEGKSSTISNLAVCMAEAGQRIILVDTDLRRPVLHKIFDVQNQIGLTNAILNHELEVSQCIQDTRIQNLRILASGTLPPNPAQFLSSEKFLGVIEQIKKEADVILFDSPPVLMFSDPSILGMRVDGVVLIIRAGYTRSGEARHAVDELSKMRINLLGSVLNRQKEGHRKGYAYYRDRSTQNGPVSHMLNKFRQMGRSHAK
jgi:non-specific protein-tyrosine kinase